MLKTVGQFILKMFGAKIMKFLMLEIAEVLVKRTDNDLDDQLLAALKRAMEKADA